MTSVLRFIKPDINDPEVQVWLEENIHLVKVIDNPYARCHTITCFDESAATEFKLKFNPMKPIQHGPQ